jgi:hypothetical protein
MAVAHPRLAGAALDWLRRFEYEPIYDCQDEDLDFTTGTFVRPGLRSAPRD